MPNHRLARALVAGALFAWLVAAGAVTARAEAPFGANDSRASMAPADDPAWQQGEPDPPAQVPAPPSPPPPPPAPPTAPPASPAAPTPAARPEDVASMDAIIAAVYDAISGPAGAPRDWDRFRSLFAPGARLVPIARRQGATAAEARVRTVEDYIAGASRGFEQSGFFESEVARTVERYGGLAHAFSTYEARRARSEEKPFVRGINSFQLLFDGTRWWVITIAWQAETPEFPLPEEYLRE